MITSSKSLHESTSTAQRWINNLTVVAIACSVASNIIASKVSNFGFAFLTSAVLVYPIVCVIDDIITECAGFTVARRNTWYIFAANLIASAVFLIACALPPASYYADNEAFIKILGVVPRVAISSILGYLVSSFVNSYVLVFMKTWMRKWDPKDKYLPLRTIGSSVAAQICDSVVFIFGVFLGVMSLRDILVMILLQVITKLAVEIICTPVTWYLVGKFKKATGIDIDKNDDLRVFAMD